MQSDAWKREAACRAYPMPAYTHWWFPTGEHAKEMPEDARAVCAECPVFEICREKIMLKERDLSASSRMGNQAGMTPKERARYYRDLRKASRKAEAKKPIKAEEAEFLEAARILIDSLNLADTVK